MLMQDAGFNSYQQVDLDAQAASASPHQLVLMLIDGFQDELIRAQGHIEAKRLDAKGISINKCMNILMGLDSALDLELGDEVAANLHDLYEFCQLELYQGSVKNDIAHLNNVALVMNNIREGWQGFGQHAAK
ncbi:flagellar export chaperone FliS [Photobacterium leiognathi]|uniref:Flagellar secretion chaperone FliS n=1 Tax=Photobacterium leiognathi TaxID=553611 RepID=A0A2T3MDT7_PHOLE|nr:flagellar export chaperone FliS [Photobacterium leiognathi]KJF97889.1 flagellar biosynthesis protein FliS [Photobacterium leiognathi]PSV91818.1 flagellar export chaperone FliS [Photobacterium leiognathi]